jgi:hypothetical protein
MITAKPTDGSATSPKSVARKVTPVKNPDISNPHSSTSSQSIEKTTVESKQPKPTSPIEAKHSKQASSSKLTSEVPKTLPHSAIASGSHYRIPSLSSGASFSISGFQSPAEKQKPTATVLNPASAFSRKRGQSGSNASTPSNSGTSFKRPRGNFSRQKKEEEYDGQGYPRMGGYPGSWIKKPRAGPNATVPVTMLLSEETFKLRVLLKKQQITPMDSRFQLAYYFHNCFKNHQMVSKSHLRTALSASEKITKDAAFKYGVPVMPNVDALQLHDSLPIFGSDVLVQAAIYSVNHGGFFAQPRPGNFHRLMLFYLNGSCLDQGRRTMSEDQMIDELLDKLQKISDEGDCHSVLIGIGCLSTVIAQHPAHFLNSLQKVLNARRLADESKRVYYVDAMTCNWPEFQCTPVGLTIENYAHHHFSAVLPNLIGYLTNNLDPEDPTDEPDADIMPPVQYEETTEDVPEDMDEDEPKVSGIPQN